MKRIFNAFSPRYLRFSLPRRAAAGCLALLCVACLGCNDLKWWNKIPGYTGEWWTRGQPKSPEQQLNASRENLHATLKDFQAKRPELAPLATQIEQALLAAYSGLSGSAGSNSVLPQLEKAAEAMLNMEGKLSVGSRAAYGELCGQLRTFEQRVQGGSTADPHFRHAFGTYAARTLSFLANELSMPAPVVL